MKKAISLLCGVLASGTMSMAGSPADAVGGSSNRFALELYQRLRGEEGNIFFSPLSISVAFAMVREGARDETRAEIDNVLHLEEKGNLAAGYQRLLSALKPSGDSPAFELAIANALWGRRDYPFDPDYLRIIRENFLAELTPVDFDPESLTRNRINDWVAGRTGGKIQNLIPPGAIDPRDTRLILTNAIYFKGLWEHPFVKAATRDEPFFVTPDRTVQAKMMNQVGTFAFAQGDTFKMLSIPYRGDELSMILLLPAEKGQLAELERKLSMQMLGQQKWQEVKVRVSVPRFKMEREIQLKPVLHEMGMRRLFSDQMAQLGGISTEPTLHVSAAIHKAFVEVNEEGTEAAAATGVVFGVTSARVGEPATFRADHPFIFLIRHNPTGAILFMGRVSDPTQ